MTELTSQLSRPKAIIFDWDNTLVDSWGAITDALNLARATYGLETWSVEEARVKSARALRDSFPEWFGDQWEAARDIFYARYHAVHAEIVKPMTGAQALLDFLHEQQIPLVIVSTKKNVLLKKEIEALGWGHYFGAVVGSLDAPRDKPDRAPVDLALSKIGLKADDQTIYFVGDTHVDVECALRSGCTPIVINNPLPDKGLGVRWSFCDCNALRLALYI